MQIRNTLLLVGLGLSVIATSATATVIDQTYDNWSNAVINNGQTMSWTFDFSNYGITSDTVIDSATLSVTAQGVDANADPVSVNTNLVVGNLSPGTGTTQFDLLGLAGTYEYLLNGLLTVSIVANEVYQYSESHGFFYDLHTYSHTHSYDETHSFSYGFGSTSFTETHTKSETHGSFERHVNTELHTVADSLELVSSNLNIVTQDHPHSVPEPSTLLLMSLGLLGLVGFTSRRLNS